MAVRDNLAHELDSRLKDLDLGKTHISVRYEPEARVARVGACITNYDWDHRAAVIDALLDFEASHDHEFSLEFDVVPFEPVHDPEYADI